MQPRASLEHSLVRLRNERGDIVGAGFLLDGGRVCTCAHVVAAALGYDATPRQRPLEQLTLEFPFVRNERCTARVQGWLPPRSYGGDVALLALEHSAPVGAEPARLLAPLAYAGRRFEVCGLPPGYPAGLWTSGVVSRRVASGWVQLETARVRGGFSGTPVWDVLGEGVIGMVAAAADEPGDAGALAWLVPLDTLLSVEPSLRALTVAPHDALTFDVLADTLLRQGPFTPLRQLALRPELSALAANFDFVGIRWTSFFAFSAALVRADAHNPEAIEQTCQQFIALNNGLYHHPQGLDIPLLSRMLAFTSAGVLCFVFEQGDAATLLEQVTERQNPAPTYAEGLPNRPWYQDRASSLFWLLDLPARRLYTQLGKRADVTNMHAYWTSEALKRLEKLLAERLALP